MVPWIECASICLDGAKPWRSRLEAVPGEAIARSRRLLEAVMREIPWPARLLADAVRLRTGGRFQEEAAALACKANVSWRDLMLANVSYDLLLANLGCSTVALPTPSGPVLARNMDWWPENLLAQASYIIHVEHRGAHRFSSAGWPGTIGIVTGLSARGFAVALNAVLCSEGSAWLGYPVLLHLRRVIEDAADFEQALDMLSRETLAMSALFTLVGRTNEQRVVIERSPRRCALRWPRDDEPLIATNDYRLLFPPENHDQGEIYQTTCARYQALTDFFARHRQEREVDDAALLYILSDARVKQTITAQHVIVRPAQGTLRLWVPRDLCM